VKHGQLLRSLLWLCSWSLAARAEGPRSLEELLGQSIVSTPSKGDETDTTAPATSTVISAEELRRYGIRSLDEAINYLSLGMATSSSLHAAELGARGVLINGDYGNHVLLLVDGHALNEPWNGTAYFERGAGVPFELIDHIEVMLGPGSVLYGSQAMLGVIHIVTKRAKDTRGLRVIVEGDTTLPTRRDGQLRGPASSGFAGDLGGGYRLATSYGREFTLGDLPSELTLELDYYENHGPTWHLGPQEYGDDFVTLAPKDFGPRGVPGIWGGSLRHADTLQVPAAYLRFSTGDFKAAVRASAYQRSTAFPDSLAAFSADFDDPFNREIDRFLNLDLSQRIAATSRLELVLHGYADLYDYHWYNRTSAPEDCPEELANGCQRRLDGVGRSLGGEVRAVFQWPLLRASTLLGMDAKVRDVEDRLDIEELATGQRVAPSGGHRTDGLLAPYIAQSFSPSSWLDLNLGLRLDHDGRFGDKLSPRSALGLTPWDGGRLKLIYAEAFRGPSAYELTYGEPNSQIPAPDLGPETVRSVEGSVEQRFGRHRLLFGVFRSWWTGLVGATELSPELLEAAVERGELTPGITEAYQRSNLGRIDNYGLNAAYDGAALQGRLRFGLNVTAANTRVDSGDGSGSQVLQVTPQTLGNARLSYDLAPAWPTLALALRFTDRRLASRVYDGGFSPAPSAPPLLALRLAASGSLNALPGLSYRIGGEYSFAKVEPYVIGALQYANDTAQRAELAPIRRAGAFIGLEYAFEPIERAVDIVDP
jgi:outer membrane receptor for ferrienterochelin and colicins